MWHPHLRGCAEPAGELALTREYTLAAAGAAAGVVGCELGSWRTGIFKRRSYWVAMAIVGGFQVAVDGWLAKTSDPIVTYDQRRLIGLRIPPGVPVEDFAYGFALLTMAIALWERAGSGQH